MKHLAILLTCLVSTAASTSAEDGELADGLYAEITTDKGAIVLMLEYEKTPLTVCNFVGLAEGTLASKTRPGVKYYDGLNFHRVMPNFMIQGGCPQGRGTGDPGYKFPDEFDSSLKHDGPGILSMANSGPGTNGSQFFITHKATPHLDGKHTVFGKVVSGQEVVDSVAKGDKMQKVSIKRVGDKAKGFKADQATFDALLATAVANSPVGKNLKEAKEFLAANKAKPGVTETSSGLQYTWITKPAAGKPKPKPTDTVSVHILGTLLDGKEFDNTNKRDKPIRVRLDQLFPGMVEGIQLMTAGSKIKLFVPPNLGFGPPGSPGLIPPNSLLILEIELMAIE